MDSTTFKDRLFTDYGGEVIAIEKYLNHKSTIRMHCGKCNTVFWARPDYLLGSSHKRHMCGQSFLKGTAKGRHKGSNISASEKIRVKLLKRQQKEIHALMEKNVSILYIALQLGLNVSTIRWCIEVKSKRELTNELENVTRS